MSSDLQISNEELKRQMRDAAVKEEERAAENEVVDPAAAAAAAAAQAQAVAQRLMAQHQGQAYPVSSGAEHAQVRCDHIHQL